MKLWLKLGLGHGFDTFFNRRNLSFSYILIKSSIFPSWPRLSASIILIIYCLGATFWGRLLSYCVASLKTRGNRAICKGPGTHANCENCKSNQRNIFMGRGGRLINTNHLWQLHWGSEIGNGHFKNWAFFTAVKKAQMQCIKMTLSIFLAYEKNPNSWVGQIRHHRLSWRCHACWRCHVYCYAKCELT